MRNTKTKVAVVSLGVIVLLLAAGSLYLYIAKKKLPPDIAAKSTSLFDVRPLVINKLQQLVLTGSDSLYHLSIDELEFGIFSSQAQAFRVSVTPDSAVLARLDKARKAPDDVFTVSFDTLRITGISVADFLHKKDIRLDTIYVSSPQVHVAHTSRPYNAAIRKKDTALTLYQKLTREFSSLSINAVVVKEADIISTDFSQKNKSTALRHVSLQLRDITIDSLTQHDTSRILFSKGADVSLRDYEALSADGLYTFKVASVSLSADQHKMTVTGLSYEPQGGKDAFQRKLTTHNDMYTIRFPDIVATDVDWPALLNRQSLYAGNITVNGGLVKDYLDRTLPRSTKPSRKDNYPHQTLVQLSFPVFVRKVTVRGLDVVYEEVNPHIQKSGTVTFNAVNGTIGNITNVAARIKAAPKVTSSLSGRFMNKVPISASFDFDLAKVRTGSFIARLHLGTVPNTLLNPIAEPLGMYTLKSGTIEETTVSIAGDNYTSTTGITMLYHDLRLFPLKDDNGKMKKQGLIGFIVNAFIVKDANPSGNEEVRHYEVPVVRDKTGGSFFNFIWQSVITGIVKTVGLPKKFADQ